MNPFAYERSRTLESAIHSMAGSSSAKFLAGGTNLIDLMKNGVEHPANLIDINRLSLADIEVLPNGGLRLGALARNSETANHSLVRQRYPVLSRAILSGASPQLRNVATNGGNLLQRTRCPYFMDVGFSHCNKRLPGSGCEALEGFNRSHAIFGASEACIASHPSDMCVALVALDATVQVKSQGGERSIPVGEFHRLPGDSPQMDSNLQKDELVLSIELPPVVSGNRAHYVKVRDRASYEFALVSVAVSLDFEDGRVKRARVVLGSVAAKPWRALEAENFLIGKPIDGKVFEGAAKKAVVGAKAYEYNAFKIEMAERAVTEALYTAGGLS
jgi:xanthine dehydrogenase YagS FAD-binding subunit